MLCAWIINWSSIQGPPDLRTSASVPPPRPPLLPGNYTTAILLLDPGKSLNVCCVVIIKKSSVGLGYDGRHTIIFWLGSTLPKTLLKSLIWRVHLNAQILKSHFKVYALKMLSIWLTGLCLQVLIYDYLRSSSWRAPRVSKYDFSFAVKGRTGRQI